MEIVGIVRIRSYSCRKYPMLFYAFEHKTIYKTTLAFKYVARSKSIKRKNLTQRLYECIN